MNLLPLLTLVVSCQAVYADVFYVKLHQSENLDCILLDQQTLSKYKGFATKDDGSSHALRIKTSQAVHSPADFHQKIEDESKIIEIFARAQEVSDAHIETLCKSVTNIPPLSVFQDNIEIQKIVNGGDQLNRIDVVFMGDGYQLGARDQFFEDMMRLTTNMFEGVTFSSYLPLFNIWAIFVPSVDSGIGYNGPQNTPFRLYREAGQLRVIWPGNSEYARQVCRMTGLSGCDYPSLIANDDFYGGLGGEFVVSTKSNRTGTVVLRHEMGHNFADVGDEYDNSWAYFGANSATNVVNVGWTSWLSGGPIPTEERAIYRLLEYPWADLSLGERSFTFTSDGTYSRFYLLVSVSAAGEEDSLEFSLDGVVLPWTTQGFDDREFYDWKGDGFSQGSHNFTVRSKTPPTHETIPRMICSVTLHEYGDETEYHTSNDYYSAYPTWDDSASRRKTLRPTNNGCLMRNMSSTTFCSVCKESMWLQFLEKVSLVDSLVVDPLPNPDGTKRVRLNTLKLGQLRAPGNEIDGEWLKTTWSRDGVEQVDMTDLFEVSAFPGLWTVRIELVTSEVHSDPQGLLVETQQFTVQ